MISCPLCLSAENTPIEFSNGRRDYLHCKNCDLRFLLPQLRLSPDQEKERYLLHNNDVSDPRYRAFVEPLFNSLIEVLPSKARGLDFGAGTGPVLSEMFQAAGFQVDHYDPYFWPDTSVLSNQYEFVFACEVVEHFYTPSKDFQLMKNILSSGGMLGIMTLLYSSEIHFESWYYRKDPTHVCFYSTKTIRWIAHRYGFKGYKVQDGRVILLQS